MKRALVWVSILAAVVVGGKYLLQRTFTQGEANNAHERVRRILDGMKAGGDLQKSICLWKEGKFTLPGGFEAFNEAANAFERWTAQRKINRITEYEIADVAVLSETERLGEAVVMVSGTIDGKAFGMRVVQGRPIEWVP